MQVSHLNDKSTLAREKSNYEEKLHVSEERVALLDKNHGAMRTELAEYIAEADALKKHLVSTKPFSTTTVRCDVACAGLADCGMHCRAERSQVEPCEQQYL